MNQPIRLTRKYITEDVGPLHGMEAVSMGFSFSRILTQKLRLEIELEKDIIQAASSLIISISNI